MAYSEAQKKATLKYRKEHLETLTLQMKKGTKDQWKEQAKSKGLSLNAYITALIKKDMEENGIHSK